MDFLVYLLKVNIAIVLFYCIFRFFFRQDTFFQWKRLALLTIVLISFAYPAIDLTRQFVANHQLKNMLETVHIPVYSIPEVVITGNTNAHINYFPQVILAVYILISCLFFFRMLFQIGTTVYKLHHTKKKIINGQTIYESQGLKTPFSFFHWIVLDPSQYSDTELQEIMMHETTHVEQVHSADTMLAELLCVVCWFNPFAWLLKMEIRMNLEFLADRSVLSSGCLAEHYQFHLLRLSYHKAAAKITNNFNFSLLKKRIFMINKKQTPYRSLWKYTLILPVVAILLFYNCTLQTKAESDKKTNETLIYAESTIQDPSQPGNEMNNGQEAKVTYQDKKHEVFNHVEEMPTFPGGEAVLFKWLQENVIYPKVAEEQGIEGTVYIKFIVKPDGSVDEVEIKKGLDPSCDREAVRAIKKMPNWNPGKQNGKTVYVYFTLPVRFKLNSGNNTATYRATAVQNNQDVVIEIDGKVVSDEEWAKFDQKTIESVTVNKNVKPNRLIITTKK